MSTKELNYLLIGALLGIVGTFSLLYLLSKLS